MNTVSRRSFVTAVTGAAILPMNTLARGLAATPQIERTKIGTKSLTTHFGFAPGVIGTEEEVLPWAFPASADSDVDILSAHLVPDLDACLGFPDGGSNGTETGRLLEALRSHPLSAYPTASLEAAGEIALAIGEGRDFTYAAEFEANTTLVGAVDQHDDVPIISRPRLRVAPLVAPSWSMELGGWKIQFRGLETHPFSGCLYPKAITHVHFDLQRSLGGGRYQNVTTFHLGTYIDRGRRCFVLYNTRPSICWPICSPSMGNLQTMLAYSLTTAAALAGVAIAGWVVAAIASAGAAALYIPLLILV